MLAPRTAVALIPAVAAVGSIAASRRVGTSPVLLALPGAAVRFGEAVTIPPGPWAEGTWSAYPLATIRSPLACRAYLARAWHYIASTRKEGPGWDADARKRWAYISTLKIQFYGPRGFAEQPGWADLAERAAKQDDGSGGTFPNTDERWRDFASFVQSVVIPGWNKEFETSDYDTRAAINQAWQKQYAAASVTEAVDAAAAALPGLPDLSPGWGGFGFALGLAAVGAVAFVALRPDVAASIAGESVARARKAGAAYRRGSR